MSDQDQVFTACARLTAAFAVLVDQHRYDELGALFTEDCRFQRPGADLAGREALVGFMSQRDRAQLTRHVCTPPVIVMESETAARGVTYLTFYQGEASESGPGRMVGATALAEYRDLFRKTADGWRIAERQVVPVMISS